jgi:DegV family protein with EDD domain
MPRFHIITDSFAHFGASPPAENITVIPNRLLIDGRSYREDVDMSSDEAIGIMREGKQVVQVLPPAISDYTTAFNELARTHDGIISIHPSREISESWQHAQTAGLPFNGRCRVVSIDSQSLSAAQAMLASLTAREAHNQASFDDLVRVARTAVDHLYIIFTVETLDSLMHNRILQPAQVLAGVMLNIRPVLSMEHGRLIAIEKVRTRAQAVDRLSEFAAEFTEVADAALIISHHPPAEALGAVHERLALDFPAMSYTTLRYGASLAALIGHDAIGLAVLENPFHRIDDDY